MTVVSHKRMSPVVALSIQPVTEESDSPEGSRPTSALSAPTEYGQSYNYRRIPRPRNPVSGWHARNLSNILPSDGAGARIPETHRRMLSNQQTWPWLARETRSQIFPDESNSTPASREASVLTDVNNNPSSGPNPGRRHRQWPWQVRSQRSSIFVGSPTTSQAGQEASNSVEVDGSSSTQQQGASRSESRSKWPWQERAMKSVIFEVLTSPPERARGKGRTYQWDQRQSTSVEAAVHQDQTSGNDKENKKRAQWPWQERAKQSEVFRSPPLTKGPRQPKYVWDQRKTRFSVKLDVEEKFPKGSHYTDNYVTWKTVQDSTKPAGKPCYTDDEVEMSQANGNGGESSKSERRRKVRIQDDECTNDELKDPSAKESKRSVKGSSCMEIVPMDYRFSKDNVSPKEKERRAR